MSFQTWTQWAVPENLNNPCGSCPGSPYGFTDQASWLIDNNPAYHDAIEVGIGSGYGYGGVNGGWDGGMQPYYTTDNGQNPVYAPASYNLRQGPGVAAWAAMAYTDPGTGPTYVQVEDSVGDNWVQAFWYGLGCYHATNCLNLAQAETLFGDDWMSGGGDVLAMYYNSPSGFQYWGYESCFVAQSDPPGPDDYWQTCHVNGTGYQWEPGGTGNGVFGSG